MKGGGGGVSEAILNDGAIIMTREVAEHMVGKDMDVVVEEDMDVVKHASIFRYQFSCLEIVKNVA